MKIRSFLIAIVAALLVLGACKSDFDLTTQWKDITVVYGLLNANDTAQYVRISKAYLDPETNALDIARIPDSSYYQNLSVQMEELNVNGNVINSYPLVKVNGEDEGYPKKPGVFSYPLNHLYKTKATIKPENSYRLSISKNDKGVITATTQVLENMNIVRPRADEAINLLPGAKANYTATWRNTRDAAFYGLILRFNYIEYPPGNIADTAQKYFDWHLFDAYVPGDLSVGVTNDFNFSTDRLYQLIAENVPVNNDIIRKVRSVDFYYAAGGKELYTYYQISQAQSGITQGQIQPTYTNVSDGYGIFSSRVFSSVTKLPLRQSTIDSIACNYRTQPLNFLNAQGLLCR